MNAVHPTLSLFSYKLSPSLTPSGAAVQHHPGHPSGLRAAGEELQPGAGPGAEHRRAAAERRAADAPLRRQLLRKPGGGHRRG